MRCDQVSRNPPSNEITVTGPNGNYVFKSTCTLFGGVSPMNFNKFNGSRTGTTTVTFKDGDSYEIVYPSFTIDNALSNHKILKMRSDKGTYVLNKDNNMISELDFVIPQKGWFSSAKKIESDFEMNRVNIKIGLCDKNKKILKTISEGYSNYLSFVQINNLCYWQVDDEYEKWNYEEEGLNMEPDCSIKRPYIQLIKEKKFAEADKLLKEVERESKNREKELNKK